MAYYTTQQLDEASDFNTSKIVRFPYLKFSSAGSKQAEAKTFTLLRNDDDGNLQAENLGEEVNVIFISRGKFRLKKASYTTNDIVPNQREIELYKINKNTGKRAFQEKGEWRELKEKYDLSTFQYPYVLLNNEIVRLGILPSSLGNYWDHCDEFKGNEKIYQFETTIKAGDEAKQSEGGIYYEMVFERGKKVRDFDNVAEKIMELNEIKKQQEFQYKQSTKEIEQKLESGMIESEDIPIIEEDDEGWRELDK